MLGAVFAALWIGFARLRPWISDVKRRGEVKTESERHVWRLMTGVGKAGIAEVMDMTKVVAREYNSKTKENLQPLCKLREICRAVDEGIFAVANTFWPRMKYISQTHAWALMLGGGRCSSVVVPVPAHMTSTWPCTRRRSTSR